MSSFAGGEAELRPTHPALARKLEGREIRKSKLHASKGVNRPAVPDAKARAWSRSEAKPGGGDATSRQCWQDCSFATDLGCRPVPARLAVGAWAVL